MNNPFISPVNAHLRKATVLLEQCEAIRIEGGSRLIQVALLEGCLFQLHLTVLNFLREIADNYQVAEADQIASVADLASALLQLDKQPAELNEIRVSENEGWLAELKTAYNSIVTGGASSKLDSPVQQAGMIQTKQLRNEEIDFLKVDQWLKQSRELIERQREMMVEC